MAILERVMEALHEWLEGASGAGPVEVAGFLRGRLSQEGLRGEGALSLARQIFELVQLPWTSEVAETVHLPNSLGVRRRQPLGVSPYDVIRIMAGMGPERTGVPLGMSPLDISRRSEPEAVPLELLGTFRPLDRGQFLDPHRGQLLDLRGGQLLDLEALAQDRDNSVLSEELYARHCTPAEPAAEGICCVCMEEQAGGPCVRIAACAHVFHDACLRPWLTQEKNTCPMCRKEVCAERVRVRNRPAQYPQDSAEPPQASRARVTVRVDPNGVVTTHSTDLLATLVAAILE